MAPAKLLVGSVVAVGSVSTAAIVANQYGVFSTSNKGQNATPDAETQTVDGGTASEQQPKPNQTEIEKWLTDNDNSKSWKIQIKKSDGSKEFKDKSITEEDLKDLKDYLDSDERKELLKSLFSSLEPKSLTFEKTDNNWKHILTKADIEKWVDKTSGSKASLKVVDGNAEKDSFSEDESIDIFKAVYGKKDMFTNVSGVVDGGKKTILFEKIDNDWKHSKSEIDKWLTNAGEGNSKFEINIKKGDNNATALNSTDEGELIGLFKYLKDGSVCNYNQSGKKATLTLKKESSWIVVSALNQ